ncbi:MAG: hypothetical protein LBR22_11245 [Desulfovibrio sp.]|jgi:membrane protein implicated in regulation of membrane protease activity|nr:hypothetical protein [Desulfovibrio sp.]
MENQQSTRVPWYGVKYKDILYYLLIAVLLIELVVGCAAFFYGIMHAAPTTPGGPPMARFPLLGWALAAVLAPAGFLLVVHLYGIMVSRFLEREQPPPETSQEIPRPLQKFYAIIRSAPNIVVLLGVLLLGALLFFVDGALTALGNIGLRLMDHIEVVVGSIAGLLAVCYLANAWSRYRQHKTEQEYAFRRDVLSRTGIVLVDRTCIALPGSGEPHQTLPAGTVLTLPESGPAPQGSGSSGDAEDVIDATCTPASTTNDVLDQNAQDGARLSGTDGSGEDGSGDASTSTANDVLDQNAQGGTRLSGTEPSGENGISGTSTSTANDVLDQTGRRVNSA